MQLLFFPIIILGVPGCPLFDGAPTSDGNLGVGLLLHALLSVSSGTNNETNEVVARVVLLRNEDLALLFARPVVGRWPVAGVCFDHFLNQERAPVHEFLLVTYFPGVETLSILIIAWWGGW